MPPAVDSPAPESLAAGELARDLLNETLSREAREKLIPIAARSAAAVITAMAANMPNNEREEYRRIPWIWRVAIVASKEGDAHTIQQLIECSLPREPGRLRDWQAVVLGGGIINGLSQRGDWPRTKVNSLVQVSSGLGQRWQDALKMSQVMADNESVRPGTRYDALRIVAMSPWPACREQLERYLSKNVNAELQMGAVSGLGDVEEIEAAELLAKHLTELSAANQKLALAALMRYDQRQQLLLAAMEDQRIAPSAITNADQQKLIGSTNSDVAARATKLFTLRR
jgi:hypothetical protein